MPNATTRACSRRPRSSCEAAQRQRPDAAATGDGPRYAIGIDLGTTHSALAWIDIAASDGDATEHGVLPVPQLTAPGAVESQPLLPSFLYLPHADELAAGELALPWAADGRHAVGELARSRGATTPIRLVSSAKSWLCHPGVDRRAAILPHDAPPEVERVSPLDASTRYLEHLRSAWDQAHPQAPFAEQDLTVTIPASFDPAARELTVEAARRRRAAPRSRCSRSRRRRSTAGSRPAAAAGASRCGPAT